MPSSTATTSARRTRAKGSPARRADKSSAETSSLKPASSKPLGGSLPASYALPPSPEQLMQLQQDYLTRLASLWTDFFQNPEKSSEPIADPRFSDPAWQNNSLASFYARTYLLNSDFMNRLADTVDADRKTKERVKFAVSQWVDAAAPRDQP
jgi:polyhydroxyalkanoate synthase